MKLDRRTFITGTGAGVIGLCSPAIATATPNIGPDRLWIQRRETGETLNDIFIYRSLIAQRAAWALYSHFWRDIKDGGEMVWIDRALLVILSDLQAAIRHKYGRTSPIILFSGYRTRQRNSTIEGAASNSQHIYGRAADFTVPHITPRQVANLAVNIPGVGGVGRYPSFTHVDTGPRGRRWGRN